MLAPRQERLRIAVEVFWNIVTLSGNLGATFVILVRPIPDEELLAVVDERARIIIHVSLALVELDDAIVQHFKQERVARQDERLSVGRLPWHRTVVAKDVILCRFADRDKRPASQAAIIEGAG